ncbi:hypothetical protein ABIB45_000979 [Arthrobacter sp. UYCo732]
MSGTPWHQGSTTGQYESREPWPDESLGPGYLRRPGTSLMCAAPAANLSGLVAEDAQILLQRFAVDAGTCPVDSEDCEGVRPAGVVGRIEEMGGSVQCR